ncbi:hypothetical protein EMIT079MI2_300002 [Bacillus sp. IT-79MI2]
MTEDLEGFYHAAAKLGKRLVGRFIPYAERIQKVINQNRKDKRLRLIPCLALSVFRMYRPYSLNDFRHMHPFS